MDFSRLDFKEIAAIACRDFLTGKVPLRINYRIRLSDVEVLVTITAEVFHLIADSTICNFAIWSLDESEFIDSGKRAQGADETNVRAFGRFNRADTTVVGRMDVSDFETCTVATETAWPEG